MLVWWIMTPSRTEPGTGRAKGSPKPWDGERSHETGYGYPVGASPYGSSPTRPTPSQQVGSELHVHTQQWEDEAGGSEAAGRVREPRKVYRRGQEDIPQGRREGKADGVHGPEGSSPGRDMASAQDTTGV